MYINQYMLFVWVVIGYKISCSRQYINKFLNTLILIYSACLLVSLIPIKHNHIFVRIMGDGNNPKHLDLGISQDILSSYLKVRLMFCPCKSTE